MNPHYTAVAQRASHRCEYCHAPELVFNIRFEVDHITPVSRGGSDDTANLALACHACNRHKSASIAGGNGRRRRPTRLFNPRIDDWNDHFLVEPASGLIQARTDVAMATLRRLKINDPRQVAARVRWIMWGIYP